LFGLSADNTISLASEFGERFSRPKFDAVTFTEAIRLNHG